MSKIKMLVVDEMANWEQNMQNERLKGTKEAVCGCKACGAIEMVNVPQNCFDVMFVICERCKK